MLYVVCLRRLVRGLRASSLDAESCNVGRERWKITAII